MRPSMSLVLTLSLALCWPSWIGATPVAQQDPTPRQCYAVAVLSMGYIKQETAPVMTALEDVMRSTSNRPEDRAAARESWEEGQALIRQSEALVEKWRPSGQVPNDQLLPVLEAMTDAEIDVAARVCVSMPAPTARTSSSAITFTREDRTDRFGNDLRMVETAPGNFEACAEVCRAESQCEAFTLYTPPPGAKGYCWLKGSAGSASAAPHSISGVRTR